MLSFKFNVIVFSTLKFSSFIHNCNAIYKLIKIISFYFKLKWLNLNNKKNDLSESQ
jgi:hypothetical protein